MKPKPSKSPPTEERVYFENWGDLGCQVVLDGKDVLTLTTPESALNMGGCPVFQEDWISPEEFCVSLSTVLRAFGASQAILDQVEWERKNYLERPIEGPHRTKAELLREIVRMVDDA